MFDPTSLGMAARHLQVQARKVARDANLASVYVKDVGQSIGQAEYDLEAAAVDLEAAASDIRILIVRLEQMRADRFIPVLQAAE